jgi:DNA-directed RNA polymerase subunit RPC12/RpoP
VYATTIAQIDNPLFGARVPCDHLRREFGILEDGMQDGDKNPRCPNCGWLDVRRSVPHSIFDRLVGLIGLVPYRCRSCGKRFYRGDRTQSQPVQ